MSRFAKLSSRWLTNIGMTLSLNDVTPDENLNQFKAKLIEERFEKCTELIAKYDRKELHIKPGCTAESTLEDEMSALLSEIRDEAGKYCFSHLPASNSALKMAICGSKGSNLNLCQMITCVGQQIVSGKRYTLLYPVSQMDSPSERFLILRKTLRSLKQEVSYKTHSSQG